MNIVRIPEIKRRMQDIGITYELVEGRVIRMKHADYNYKQTLPESIKSINHAAARDAWRVLKNDEQLAGRWRKTLVDPETWETIKRVNKYLRRKRKNRRE